MTNEEALAYMYTKMRETLADFPSSFVDRVVDELPDGYEHPYQLIEQANQAADEITRGLR